MNIQLLKSETYLSSKIEELIKNVSQVEYQDEEESRIAKGLFLPILRIEIYDFFDKKHNNCASIYYALGHPEIHYDNYDKRLHDIILEVELDFEQRTISSKNHNGKHGLLQSNSVHVDDVIDYIDEFIGSDDIFKGLLFHECEACMRSKSIDKILDGNDNETLTFGSKTDLEKYVRKYQDPEGTLAFFWFEGVLFECMSFDLEGKEVNYRQNCESPKDGFLTMFTENRYGVLGMTDASIGYFI